MEMLMKVCQNDRCQRIESVEYGDSICPDCGSKMLIVRVTNLSGLNAPKPEPSVSHKACKACGRLYLFSNPRCPSCGCMEFTYIYVRD